MALAAQSENREGLFFGEGEGKGVQRFLSQICRYASSMQTL